MNEIYRGLTPDPQEQFALPNSEASASYFKLVRRALPMALRCLAAHGTPQLDQTIYEGEVVSEMLQRLLYDCSLLELKFAFKEDGDVNNRPHVDLEESGFPSFGDIDNIAVDLMHKEVLLRDFRSDQTQLKKLVLDRLIGEHREPRGVLEELARRTYLDMLDPDKLFLPYTPGKLVSWKTNEKNVRGYLFSWGTYSALLNCPYVHLMFFTQDLSEQPFEQKGDNLAEFLRVISDEGAHVPDQLHVLAKAIDERLDPIHPKVLKRVRIGPLHAPALIGARDPSKLTKTEVALKSLFDRAGSKDDFALMFSEEMTFSKEQVAVTKYLFKKVVQEVFFIPLLDEGEDNLRYILMPHRLYQEMQPEEAECLPRFSKRIKFSYDQRENVNEIS